MPSMLVREDPVIYLQFSCLVQNDLDTMADNLLPGHIRSPNEGGAKRDAKNHKVALECNRMSRSPKCNENFACPTC